MTGFFQVRMFITPQGGRENHVDKRIMVTVLDFNKAGNTSALSDILVGQSAQN
jgi:hypothetical protein